MKTHKGKYFIKIKTEGEKEDENYIGRGRPLQKLFY